MPPTSSSSPTARFTLWWRTRKEDPDFYYWLNMVEFSATTARVARRSSNEKQDRRREIRERQLRGTVRQSEGDSAQPT